MPKLLELLSQLEEAIPDIKAGLEGNPDYMDGESAEEEGAMPPPPDFAPMGEEGDEEEPADLETPPPFKKKSKGPALPF